MRSSLLSIAPARVVGSSAASWSPSTRCLRAIARCRNPRLGGVSSAGDAQRRASSISPGFGGSIVASVGRRLASGEGVGSAPARAAAPPGGARQPASDPPTSRRARQGRPRSAPPLHFARARGGAVLPSSTPSASLAYRETSIPSRLRRSEGAGQLELPRTRNKARRANGGAVERRSVKQGAVAPGLSRPRSSCG